jgi:hypothetical protein
VPAGAALCCEVALPIVLFSLRAIQTSPNCQITRPFSERLDVFAHWVQRGGGGGRDGVREPRNLEAMCDARKLARVGEFLGDDMTTTTITGRREAEAAAAAAAAAAGGAN